MSRHRRHHLMYLTATLIISSGISGCTTVSEKHTSNVTAFSKTVEVQLEAVEKKLVKAPLELAEKRRKAMLAGGAYFDVLDCEPVTEFVAFDIIAPDSGVRKEEVDFRVSERCQLAAKVRDADTGEVSSFADDSFTPGETGLRTQKRLAKSLTGYASSLSEIATSSSTTEVKSNLESAFDALQAVANQAASLDEGPGLTEKAQEAATKGKAFGSQFAANALEISRFRALKGTVVESNETVGEAALVLASVLYDYEKPELDELMNDFRLARREQGKTRLSAEEREAALVAFEKAKSALEAADDARGSLAVLQIARTHDDLARSLSTATPKDIIAAQNSVTDLVLVTDEFIKSLE